MQAATERLAAKAIEDVSSVSFVVETMVYLDGRKLGKIKPDEYGYYDMPLAVIGAKSRNRTYYETATLVNQIENPETRFNQLLTQGNMFGEYGHPSQLDFDDPQKYLERLMIVKETQHSHHFRRVNVGGTLENGGRLVNGLLKPEGPYKRPLQDSIDNPFINTAFSLRSIVTSTNKMIDGEPISWRKVEHLVTFDAVLAGGFAQASKRYSTGAAVESINKGEVLDCTFVNLKLDHGLLASSKIACESLQDGELNELFKSRTVHMVRESVTLVKLGAIEGFIDGDRRMVRSISHKLLGR
jgi:hypothetical protein